MLSLKTLDNTKSILGEGPFFHKKQNSLYWTDIKAHKIFKYDFNKKQVDDFQFNKAIGAFSFTKSDKIIAATNDGFEYLNLENHSTQLINNPESHLPENRFNDGKCDKNGRFFAGTMDNNEKSITGALYFLEKDKVNLQEKNLFISNGLGWNNQSTKFYLTDSPKRIIYQFDYDLKTANLSNKKIFAQIKKQDGYPDGLCVDSDDYIWSAHWDGAKITRYSEDGSIDLEIKIPAKRVTSCAFGGEDLKTLFITTASFGLSDEQLKKYPLSGQVFALKTSVKGQDTNFFKN